MGQLDRPTVVGVGCESATTTHTHSFVNNASRRWSKPVEYRLATRGQTLLLQGLFKYESQTSVWHDWEDLPTINLDLDVDQDTAVPSTSGGKDNGN